MKWKTLTVRKQECLPLKNSTKAHLEAVLQEEWNDPRKSEMKDLLSKQNGKNIDRLKYILSE